jgi:transcriptional regulator GlxA family with amidase domain
VPDTASAATSTRPVWFGILLLPDFTLTAFSGLVDMLRLASDEGDNSRPVRCCWSLIGEGRKPVRASCGIETTPWEDLGDPSRFDYVVVVGGLLRKGSEPSRATLDFIRSVGETRTTLVGICTGTFALMRAGVLARHRVCVSWFHYWDFLEQFPHVEPSRLVADRLFVVDGHRITCSGGRASIDVAAEILKRHIDASTVQKALRILLVDRSETVNAPQPHPPGLEPSAHPIVKRAMLLMEQHLSKALTVDEMAGKLNVSARQFERIFKADTGKTPQAFARALRLRVAAWSLLNTDKPISAVSSECGFADASHMGREFRQIYAVSPSDFRRKKGDVRLDDVNYHEIFPNRTEFY